MQKAFDHQKQLELESQKHKETLLKLSQALNALESAEAVVVQLQADLRAREIILRETAKKAIWISEQPLVPEDTMAYVNGDKFHCEDCGCNIFRHPVDDPMVFVCNACEARYIGEK